MLGLREWEAGARRGQSLTDALNGSKHHDFADLVVKQIDAGPLTGHKSPQVVQGRLGHLLHRFRHQNGLIDIV
jgi:hypothetical protein